MSNIVWIHYARARSRWYELDAKGRQRLMNRWAELDQTSVTTGGSKQGPFNVRGQSDYSSVEVWMFPTIEAAYEHWAAKVEAGYAEWFLAANNIGARDLP